ncbi:MAG: YihY/virulence factor BrkB family protein [Phototrophicaceae bacterium]
MMKVIQTLYTLMRQTVQEWMEDGAASIAAALAYYAVFSLSPLLILVSLIVGSAISPVNQDDILQPVESTIGAEAAETFRAFMNASQQTSSTAIGTTVWIVIIIWGASGLFAQLQDALNKIWEVKPAAGQSPLLFVQNRALSFLIVLVGAGLLIGTTLINTTITTLIRTNVDIAAFAVVIRPLQILVSLGMMTLLFMIIFKVLPDVIISWKDVIVGSVFTAFLFLVGQFLVGLYIANADPSLGGVAGSLTIILVWIYYSAQILLFGAEFTEVWARHHGAYIRPDSGAEWVNVAKARREAEAAGIDFDEANAKPAD